jgi:UDPglucose 6-dehydrogenase
MNISIIGTGYVGLVSGACFASLGHRVICVDVDKEKVDQINNSVSPIYEKGLTDLLEQYKTRIQATTSYEEAIKESEITFICVGTPSKVDGDIDLSYIDQAAVSIAQELKKKKLFHSVVVKSTVVPGTTQNHVLPILEKESGKKAGIDFGVGMNPEFLREGVAVDDFLHPDRVVNGYYDERTKKTLTELYNVFSCPKVYTSLTAAEMIKYASNSFLATKISFINELGNLCKNLGVDTYEVAEGMGLDKRIERAFLNAGIGWGGSCFPKDVSALIALGEKRKIPCNVMKSAVSVNEKQPLFLIDILKRYVPVLNGKTICVLGLAFKPDTDDIRDTRAEPIVKALLAAKAKIKTYDPKAMDNFKKIYPNLVYCKTAKEAIKDADAVLLTTEWDEFKTLDFSGKLVIDGRHMLTAKVTAEVYDGVCW